MVLVLLRWGRWREDRIPSIKEWSFIYREKNTCPDKAKRIHNVQLGVRDQNKETKIKEENSYFYSNANFQAGI